ncbi:MAG TPA: hypothetical protein VK563_09675 [Puia sp.]|nr:hypothetical protein [Puia sp.]
MNRTKKAFRIAQYFFLIAGLTGTLQAFSQDCKSYFFLQKNKTIEMTIYNKKGEPNGKMVYLVSDVATAGATTTAALASEMFDKKGKSTAKANSSIRCNGGVMMIDMKMMIPQQQAAQFKTDVKADNVYLEYPANMQPGADLKDGNFSMEMNNGGLAQTLNMLISNRKVEGKESVTTEAGTWDCFKISFKSKIGVKTGFINIPINMDGTEWFAPGFGVVKSQSKYGGTAITSIK